VKSTAILFGRRPRDGAAFPCSHAVAAGVLQARSPAWVCGIMPTWRRHSFALYQQELMRERTRDGCFRAFLNNNWFGAAVFTGLLLNYLSIK
jgi:4-hydroxybenzoate polyprenyltransferase